MAIRNIIGIFTLTAYTEPVQSLVANILKYMSEEETIVDVTTATANDDTPDENEDEEESDPSETPEAPEVKEDEVE